MVINMDKLLEEKKRHSSQIRPFSYYKCLVPDYFANVPLHWHAQPHTLFMTFPQFDFVLPSLIIPQNKTQKIQRYMTRQYRNKLQIMIKY